MTRYFPAGHIPRAVCLATVAACSSQAVAVEAQDAATRSVPRNYALFSQTTKGRKVPKFVLRVDTYVYPAGTSYRQFLTAGAPRTPEAVLARFVELINAPRADSDAFLALFSPAARRTEKDVKGWRATYLDLRSHARQLGEPKLSRRYDFGNFSQMEVSLPQADRNFLNSKSGGLAMLSFLASVASIERAGDRAYISGNMNPPGNASSLGQLVFARTPFNGKVVLPYSLRVPNDSPATKNIHPVDVLFEGAPLDVPLDGKTHTSFASVNFLQHAAQVIRADKTSDTLALWDAASTKEIRAALQKNSMQGNASYVESLLSNPSRRIAFVMDFDEGAVIFLRYAKAADSVPVFELARVFKEKGAYKLSFEANSGLNTRNLEILLEAPYFQDYLRKIATAHNKSAP